MISQTPWRRGIGNECHTVFDAQGSVVAAQVGTDDGTLIAAAPDLLAELKNCLRLLEDIQAKPGLIQVQARAAITKATS